MRGLELSRRFYEEAGRPALERLYPEALPHLCAGLVGEGSECLGFDDENSQDHDWGPGFCLWLTREDFQRFGPRLRELYAALPRTWEGYTRLREDPMSAGRVGVFTVEEFYARFLGRTTPPEKPADWLTISDQALSVCTNGEIFEDNDGAFTAFRQELLKYYPEDIRKKRLAAQCALAAQSGQYNLPRCLKRGDQVAAFLALAEFIDHAQGAVFLLEKRYRPYYKWAHRALQGLPQLGEELSPLFEMLTAVPLQEAIAPVEAISARIIDALAAEKLSSSKSDFLLDHARNLQNAIQDAALRELPLMFPGG